MWFCLTYQAASERMMESRMLSQCLEKFHFQKVSIYELLQSIFPSPFPWRLSIYLKTTQHGWPAVYKINKKEIKTHLSRVMQKCAL